LVNLLYEHLFDFFLKFGHMNKTVGAEKSGASRSSH